MPPVARPPLRSPRRSRQLNNAVSVGHGSRSPALAPVRRPGMSDTHEAIEAVWKIESTRLIAGIARVTRDIGLAEELAQDALIAAVERWPEEGTRTNLPRG